MWVCMLKGGGGVTGDDYVSSNLTAPSHTSVCSEGKQRISAARRGRGLENTCCVACV